MTLTQMKQPQMKVLELHLEDQIENENLSIPW